MGTEEVQDSSQNRGWAGTFGCSRSRALALGGVRRLVWDIPMGAGFESREFELGIQEAAVRCGIVELGEASSRG